MNKNELVKNAATRAKISQKECLCCLNAITDLIKDVLRRGEKVSIVGFGRFEVRTRSERIGVNPKTLSKIKIPTQVVPSFKSGSALKKAVR